MGAYNWLHASIRCYNCDHEETKRFQAPIGWCHYQDYTLGDHLEWMTPADRERAKEAEREWGYPLRTMIEIGSPEWLDFGLSTGDFQCAQCSARGTVLAMVKDNVFREVVFTRRELPYGKVLRGKELEEFIKE